MDAKDKAEFQKALAYCGIAFDKEVTKNHLQVYFTALSDYSIEQVQEAIFNCVKRCKFFPRPADIIEAVGDNGVSPNEAWAIALKAHDEYETVVWTKEIAECWGAARAILDAGDKVGARMAFIEAYSRRDTSNPEWIVSKGIDKARQVDAINNAIERKLLAPCARALVHQHLKLEDLRESIDGGELSDDAKREMLSQVKSLLETQEGAHEQ